MSTSGSGNTSENLRTRFLKVLKRIVAGPRTWAPSVFFVFDLVILLLLLLIGPFHVATWSILRGFGNPFSNVMPSVVPWAGALGGVCISIVGVAGNSDHHDWRPDRFGYWHLTRPILGATFGTTAVLIVVLLLQNVKVASPATSGAGYSVSGQAVLAVIAFVVGFRERTFRTLVARVVDLIVGPSSAAESGHVSFVPNVVDFGNIGVGSQKAIGIYLFNGSASTLRVTAKSLVVSVADVVIGGDEKDAELRPGRSIPFTLTWQPTRIGPLAAAVTLEGSSAKPSCSLLGSATA